MSTLGDRMKSYEAPWRALLPPRMPIVLRVDGRAFHTVTRGAVKPFDARIIRAMDSAALELCEGVAGAVMGYVQSDEISVLIHPYKRHESQTWFGGEIVKMVSIAACLAANGFRDVWERAVEFDARVFVLPEADVCNYFLWRQQDAERNSILGCAQARLSHKAMQGVSTRALQDIMLREHDFNWNDLATSLKRGRTVLRSTYEVEGEDGPVTRSRWSIDNECPRFGVERGYIEDLLRTEAES